MAFKRIVANSEEDLETIMKKIIDWFEKTDSYETEKSIEKRKFQDPDTKEISEKDINVLKVQEPLKDKNGKIVDYKKATIKFIPMKVKNEMKVEIGGEGETVIASKIKDQVEMNRTRDNSSATPLGKLKSYSKDKKVALKEQLDRRIANVFFKYKGKSFPMDYKPGSVFAKFIGDLEESGAFSSDDEVSDFMSSEEFDMYANKFGVEIDYADYDPTPLELADKEPINPQDMIPGRAPGDFNSDITPHRVTDLMEKLKRTGKLKKSELKEIIKKFNK